MKHFRRKNISFVYVAPLKIGALGYKPSQPIYKVGPEPYQKSIFSKCLWLRWYFLNVIFVFEVQLIFYILYQGRIITFIKFLLV